MKISFLLLLYSYRVLKCLQPLGDCGLCCFRLSSWSAAECRSMKEALEVPQFEDAEGGMTERVWRFGFAPLDTWQLCPHRGEAVSPAETLNRMES